MCIRDSPIFALPGPVGPTVAVGLILTRELVLASVFMSVCCLHTPSWVSRSCPLSNHPGGEDVTTVLRDHIFRVQLLLCRGYAGSELTVQQRSPRDCRRWIIAVSPHVLAHYFGIYVAPACWSNLTMPKPSLLSVCLLYTSPSPRD